MCGLAETRVRVAALVRGILSGEGVFVGFDRSVLLTLGGAVHCVALSYTGSQ